MASNNNGFHAQLLKLNGRNYHHCSIQLKVFLESQDLWGIVEDGIRVTENPTPSTAQQTKELNENRKKDKKALFYIFQSVEEAIFERISTSDSSKEAWDMLFKAYRGEDRVKIVRLQTLRCEFDGLKMKESESVEEFYNRVITLMNQIRLNGENIEEKRVVEKILRSLTRKFEYIVVAIEESKDLSTLSLENLLGILQSHELRMRQFDDVPIEKAFQVSYKLKGKASENYLDVDKEINEDEERTFKGEQKFKGKRIPLSEKQCYYCNKYGHLIRFCKKKQQDDSQEESKFMEESKETMFMVVNEDDKGQQNDVKNESKEEETMFLTFESDELVMDDTWKSVTSDELGCRRCSPWRLFEFAMK